MFIIRDCRQVRLQGLYLRKLNTIIDFKLRIVRSSKMTTDDDIANNSQRMELSPQSEENGKIFNVKDSSMSRV